METALAATQRQLQEIDCWRAAERSEAERHAARLGSEAEEAREEADLLLAMLVGAKRRAAELSTARAEEAQSAAQASAYHSEFQAQRAALQLAREELREPGAGEPVDPGGIPMTAHERQRFTHEVRTLHTELLDVQQQLDAFQAGCDAREFHCELVQNEVNDLCRNRQSNAQCNLKYQQLYTEPSCCARRPTGEELAHEARTVAKLSMAHADLSRELRAAEASAAAREAALLAEHRHLEAEAWTVRSEEELIDSVPHGDHKSSSTYLRPPEPQSPPPRSGHKTPDDDCRTGSPWAAPSRGNCATSPLISRATLETCILGNTFDLSLSSISSAAPHLLASSAERHSYGLGLREAECAALQRQGGVLRREHLTLEAELAVSDEAWRRLEASSQQMGLPAVKFTERSRLGNELSCLSAERGRLEVEARLAEARSSKEASQSAWTSAEQRAADVAELRAELHVEIQAAARVVGKCNLARYHGKPRRSHRMQEVNTSSTTSSASAGSTPCLSPTSPSSSQKSSDRGGRWQLLQSKRCVPDAEPEMGLHSSLHLPAGGVFPVEPPALHCQKADTAEVEAISELVQQLRSECEQEHMEAFKLQQAEDILCKSFMEETQALHQRDDAAKQIEHQSWELQREKAAFVAELTTARVECQRLSWEHSSAKYGEKELLSEKSEVSAENQELMVELTEAGRREAALTHRVVEAAVASAAAQEEVIGADKVATELREDLQRRLGCAQLEVETVQRSTRIESVNAEHRTACLERSAAAMCADMQQRFVQAQTEVETTKQSADVAVAAAQHHAVCAERSAAASCAEMQRRLSSARWEVAEEKRAADRMKSLLQTMSDETDALQGQLTGEQQTVAALQSAHKEGKLRAEQEAALLRRQRQEERQRWNAEVQALKKQLQSLEDAEAGRSRRCRDLEDELQALRSARREVGVDTIPRKPEPGPRSSSLGLLSGHAGSQVSSPKVRDKPARIPADRVCGWTDVHDRLLTASGLPRAAQAMPCGDGGDSSSSSWDGRTEECKKRDRTTQGASSDMWAFSNLARRARRNNTAKAERQRNNSSSSSDDFTQARNGRIANKPRTQFEQALRGHVAELKQRLTIDKADSDGRQMRDRGSQPTCTSAKQGMQAVNMSNPRRELLRGLFSSETVADATASRRRCFSAGAPNSHNLSGTTTSRRAPAKANSPPSSTESSLERLVRNSDPFTSARKRRARE